MSFWKLIARVQRQSSDGGTSLRVLIIIAMLSPLDVVWMESTLKVIALYFNGTRLTGSLHIQHFIAFSVAAFIK